MPSMEWHRCQNARPTPAAPSTLTSSATLQVQGGNGLAGMRWRKQTIHSSGVRLAVRDSSGDDTPAVPLHGLRRSPAILGSGCPCWPHLRVVTYDPARLWHIGGRIRLLPGRLAGRPPSRARQLTWRIHCWWATPSAAWLPSSMPPSGPAALSGGGGRRPEIERPSIGWAEVQGRSVYQRTPLVVCLLEVSWPSWLAPRANDAQRDRTIPGIAAVALVNSLLSSYCAESPGVLAVRSPRLAAAPV
jgi:hypothetical protein